MYLARLRLQMRALVFFSAAIAPLTGLSESLKETHDYAILSQGIPGLSMAAYGLVARNLHSSDAKPESLRAMRDQVRNRIAEQFAGPKSHSVDQATEDFVNAAYFVLARLDTRVEAENAKNLNAPFRIAENGIFTLSIPSRPNSSEYANVALSLAAGSSALRYDANLAYYLRNAEKSRWENVSALVRLALHRACQRQDGNSQSLCSTVKNKQSDSKTIDQLIALNRDLFESTLLTRLSVGSATAVRRIMLEFLEGETAHGIVLTKEAAAHLEATVSATKNRIVDLETGLERVRSNVSAQLTAVSEAQSNVSAVLDSLRLSAKKLNDASTINPRDLAFVQEIGFGRINVINPSALVNVGLMQAMPNEAKALGSAISKLSIGTSLQQNVNNAVGAVKASAALAERLGVHIDVGTVEHSIRSVRGGYSIVNNLMGANFIGAVFSLGGLFGGGGPDMADLYHQEEMAKLNDIVKLQEELLRKMDELAKQINDSTETILGKLADLEYKQDLTNEMLVSDKFGAAKRACARFENTAQLHYGLDEHAQFPSYEARLSHYTFDRDKDGNHFQACVDFLHKGIATLDSDGTMHDALKTKFVEYKNAKNWQTVHWAPMYQFTLAMLNEKNENCSSRLLGQLARAPEHFSDIPYDTFSCLDNGSGSYRNEFSKQVNGNEAMKDALYWPTVRFFGEALGFYAAYYEFMKPSGNVSGNARQLYNVRDLADLQPSRDPSTGSLWMSGYLDVVNMALAQEVLYSGVLITNKVINDVIRATSFGTKAHLPVAGWTEKEKKFLVKKSNNDVTICNALEPGYSEGLYFAAICLMASNPFFQDNVVATLVLQALAQSREKNLSTGSAILYRIAYYNPSMEYAQRVMPGLPIEWLKVGDFSGWHLRLVNLAGKPWYLSLPPPVVVEESLISYSPLMPQIRNYKRKLEARYVAFSAHQHLAKNPNLQGNNNRERRHAALQLMQQASLYTPNILSLTRLPDLDVNDSAMTEKQ